MTGPTTDSVDEVFGTVATFDPVPRAGTVLLDDGRALDFAADAFDVSGLLTLRLGQRLRLRLDPSGRVRWLTLSTFPAPGTDPREAGLGRP